MEHIHSIAISFILIVVGGDTCFPFSDYSPYSATSFSFAGDSILIIYIPTTTLPFSLALFLIKEIYFIITISTSLPLPLDKDRMPIICTLTTTFAILPLLSGVYNHCVHLDYHFCSVAMHGMIW